MGRIYYFETTVYMPANMNSAKLKFQSKIPFIIEATPIQERGNNIHIIISSDSKGRTTFESGSGNH